MEVRVSFLEVWGQIEIFFGYFWMLVVSVNVAVIVTR